MQQAYKIAVALSMTSNVAAVLGVLQKDVLKLKHAVDLTSGGFSKLKLAVAGVAGVALGGAMLTGLYDLSKAADKYISQLDEMKNKGLNATQIDQARAAANRVANSVQTTTPTQNLKSYQDLRQALGSHEHALEYLEITQKISAMMEQGMRAIGHGGGGGNQVYGMANALELMGAAMNPQRFKADLDRMLKTSQALNYNINGNDFQAMIKYAKSAAPRMSDEYAFSILPIFGAELKSKGGSASTAGVAAMSFYQKIVGGQLSEKEAKLLAAEGLLDPAKIVRSKNGSIKGVLPGGVAGSGLAAANAYDWVQQVLLPALARHGITNPQKIAETIAGIFTNRNAQAMVTNFATQQARYEKDRAMIGQAKGVARYDALVANNPEMAKIALGAQWERLKTDLGIAINPTTTVAIRAITQAVAWIASEIEKHPTMAKAILLTAGALGALLTVAGGLAIGAAAIMGIGTALAGLATVTGLIVGGAVIATIAAVAGALYLFLKWDTVWPQIKAGMASLISNVAEALKSLPAMIWDSIKQTYHSLTHPDLQKENQQYEGIFPGSYRGPPGANTHMDIHNILYLDGDVVYRNTMRRAARDASRPQGGFTGFDPRMTPPSFGAVPV